MLRKAGGDNPLSWVCFFTLVLRQPGEWLALYTGLATESAFLIGSQ